MRNSILRHPNAVRSKNVATKRCTVVHKARYVFLLDVVRVNHFRVHNLKKSRDILTDPIHRSPRISYLMKKRIKIVTDIFGGGGICKNQSSDRHWHSIKWELIWNCYYFNCVSLNALYNVQNLPPLRADGLPRGPPFPPSSESSLPLLGLPLFIFCFLPRSLELWLGLFLFTLDSHGNTKSSTMSTLSKIWN